MPATLGRVPRAALLLSLCCAAAGPARAVKAEDGAPPGLSVCLQAFAENGGVAIATPRENDRPECAIEDPVTFKRINLPDGAAVDFDSAVTLRCPFALDIAAWVRGALAEILARDHRKLTGLTGAGGHECRPRNGVAGAPLSEHAIGNALDLTGVKTADGQVIAMASTDAASRPLRDAVAKSLCARFTTVLGPGADASHKEHVHIDLRERHGGYRICQWNVE